MDEMIETTIINDWRSDIEMNHNIAYCVPTYNHPDTVDEVLGLVLSMYDKYGIDIYIYDTSEDDATKKVVEKYNSADNLYYVDMTPEISGCEKVVYILSGYGLRKEYEYICIIKDRTYFDELTIQKIQEASCEGYDAIILPVVHWPLDPHPQDKTEVYSDMLSLFKEYGKMIPNLETVLFKYDSLLKNFNKDEFICRHFEERLCCFEQFIALFEQLLTIDSPKVKVLREQEVIRYTSLHSSSMWESQIFEVWVYFWSKAVDMLPAYYDPYKALVKKEETMQPVLFGSIHNIERLVENGTLTNEILEKYRELWAGVSDIPLECVEYMLKGQYDKVIYIFFDKWNECFSRQESDKAYHMFYSDILFKDNWLKAILGKYTYHMLNRCFQVYKLELERNVQNTIFTNTNSYIDVVDKYQMMKYLLRRLEYDCADEILDDIFPYFYEKKLSMQCLLYIIYNECINEEKIITYWQKLSDKYHKESRHE